MNLIDYGRKKWDYLLKADFGGSNSGAIANGGSVEAASSGSVQAGTLTVSDSGLGSVSVVSNKLRVDPDNNAAWTIGVYCPTPFTRQRGLALKVGVDMQDPTPDSNMTIGFINSSNPLTAGYNNGIYLDGLTTDKLITYMAGTTVNIDTLTTAAYEFGFVIGGYSSGVPWDGIAAGYSDGLSLFIKEGGNYLLKYRSGVQTTTPLYFGGRASVFDYIDVDNIAIPNADLSHLLKPLVLDTFTDTNGTALTAHTPDVDVVGGGWTISGTWEIQSNRAETSGTLPATPRWMASIDSGKSDVFIETIYNQSASATGSTGPLIRYVDNDNFWQVGFISTLFNLQERTSGTWTQRASATVSTSKSTDYRVTVIANGQTIKGFLSDGNSISYGSATSHQTATKHGLRGAVANDVYDNFAVYPIGTSGEYSDLDRY